MFVSRDATMELVSSFLRKPAVSNGREVRSVLLSSANAWSGKFIIMGGIDIRVSRIFRRGIDDRSNADDNVPKRTKNILTTRRKVAFAVKILGNMLAPIFDQRCW